MKKQHIKKNNPKYVYTSTYDLPADRLVKHLKKNWQKNPKNQ